MTQHAHPNIYTAVQLFKDIQNSIEIAEIQRAVGGIIRNQAQNHPKWSNWEAESA
jgi:hypothetical protein